MSLVPGLSPNIRLSEPEPGLQLAPIDVVVAEDDEQQDTPEYDDKGAILRIEHPDGSITVSLDGKPIDEAESRGPKGWFDNLAEDISDLELSRISSELLRGVEDDLETRQEWIEDRAQGIKLLGLKVEIPNLAGASDGAPVEGMSRVRHPLLLEAVLRFQANARSEMLPTDGPVKIRDDSNGSTAEQDQLADALEKDFNHYLTSTATEYYPDTDRMLLLLGFGGTAFKKVYFCPLRNRPVSETVDADDLIVSNNASDLQNARRITHRVSMKPSTVKRLQIMGVYRDTELSQAAAPKLDAVKEEKDAQQGISSETKNPDDRDREIYEIYCELDIVGYEHKYKGKISGLEVPYRVTIDVSSKQILSIVRNYDKNDEELPDPRANFVKYTFVPGFGFYDIGLLHILGNTTNAITAAWRELLDAGMYSNFPGFLFADTGARQNTNIFRVPPGGGAPVKTGGMPINQAIMPLPYKEPSPALMSLVNDIATTGMRIGGTSEQQVGEGRADAPVGTTLAMIEQAAKVLNSVHKRMHASQAEEFRLLARCFKENPNSFWQRNKTPAYTWDEKVFLKALEDNELSPQADPNTASAAQRMMKLAALKQLQASNPTMYDPIAIDRACIQALGFSNPDQFMAPPSAQAAPPPEMQKQMAEMQVKKQQADAQTLKAQADMLKAQHEASAPHDVQQQQVDTPVDLMTARAKLMDAQTKRHSLGIQQADVMQEDRNRAADRASHEKIQLLELARDIALHPQAAPIAAPIAKQAEQQ